MTVSSTRILVSGAKPKLASSVLRLNILRTTSVITISNQVTTDKPIRTRCTTNLISTMGGNSREGPYWSNITHDSFNVTHTD